MTNDTNRQQELERRVSELDTKLDRVANDVAAIRTAVAPRGEG